MTAIKLDGKPGKNAALALEPLAQYLFRTPGARIVVVAELAVVETVVPAPDEEKDPSVKLGVKSLEIGTGEKEHVLRSAMNALYVQRTARGTITEEGEVELSEQTLALTAGRLADVDAAKVRAACREWARYAERALNSDLTREGLAAEVKTIAAGLRAINSGGIEF